MHYDMQAAKQKDSFYVLQSRNTAVEPITK